jgi:hypothetical protein
MAGLDAVQGVHIKGILIQGCISDPASAYVPVFFLYICTHTDCYIGLHFYLNMHMNNI